MKKASNKISIKSLKDCSSNKQMKENKKIFSISCIQVVTIHFTNLKINGEKHDSSMNKLNKHEKNRPRRGLDREERAVIKDKMRPKRKMKKRKL